MKIYFERSGGFMGREVSTVVDTNRLPPEQALSLLEKLDEADFFCLPQTPASGLENMSGVDQYCYKVTVELAGIERTIETSDTAAPEELQPLLDELTQFARESDRPVGDAQKS